MKKIAACCLITVLTSLGCRKDDKTQAVGLAETEKAKAVGTAETGKPKAVGLAGTYKGEHFSMVFEKGKCFCVNEDGKDRVETDYLIKKDKVYVAPIVPKGEKMTRNVWVVYTIKEKMLESSHVEDMDTGDVFYKDQKPPIILAKE